jgi:hypothetical protein
VIGIGMILLWAGYGIGTYGYVLIRGWNISPGEWFSPLSPYAWPAGSPPCYTGSGILPSGDAADNGPCGSTSAGFSPDTFVAPTRSGKCPAGSVRQATPNGGWKCVPRQYIAAPLPPGGGLT